jgi:glucosamine--fructose-6-phosphate aminotransferase (isomerizing)
MYDAILAQPEAFVSVVADNSQQIKTAQQLINASQRIFLVGTGTSYHAAWAAEYIFKNSVKNKRVSSFTAINFALYGEELSNNDVVMIFSHRGTKKYSLQSLEKAQQASAKTILITGKQKHIEANIADVVIQTVEQEESSAHTIGYTSALAIIVGLVNGPLTDLAKILDQSLELEDSIHSQADGAKDCRKIWSVGGGPSEVTAKEVALKIKETSYTQAEGVGNEELMHGPFQSAEPEDFFILIAPNGKTQRRTLELVEAIKAIGANYLIISDAEFDQMTITVPVTAEEYTTISCILPLQLFSYYLALDKDTNPDNFRLEDPRFAKAAEYIKL